MEWWRLRPTATTARSGATASTTSLVNPQPARLCHALALTPLRSTTDLLSKNLAGVVVSIIAFEADCVVALADAAADEPSYLKTAMNLISGVTASPPPAPPPAEEPNWTAGYVFISILGFCCVCAWTVTWYSLKSDYDNSNTYGGYRR